jgi:catechol 2,3-dioxygenase-like lactoylglutathione lyase family enzyme
MKLNAVGVASSDMRKSIAFYTLLGFEFDDYDGQSPHVESKSKEGNIRLMIDSETLIEGLIGDKPRPGNHSAFAIEYDSAKEVDNAAHLIKDAGFTVVKEPWDAFWGQRYAVVADPDGHMVDLYAKL